MSEHTQARSDERWRILMVDDDVKLCRLVRDYLEPLGYDVIAAHTGISGLSLAVTEPFAAVILDVMLPGIDGFDVLRKLREQSEVPVLMLTGRGEEPDRISGLEAGADDYLPKAFSTSELLARLRAVIRRSVLRQVRTEEQSRKIVVGDLTLNPETRKAAVNDDLVPLTALEFDLLLTLAKFAGQIRSREQLMLDVAERHPGLFDRTIDVHVSAIRRKLGDDARSPKYIVTVRSAGYMLRKPDKLEPGLESKLEHLK